MFALNRTLSLVAAGALVALTAAGISARADQLARNQGPVWPHEATLAVPNAQQVGECHLLRRAISRRACQARLLPSEQIDTAEKK